MKLKKKFVLGALTAGYMLGSSLMVGCSNEIESKNNTIFQQEQLEIKIKQEKIKAHTRGLELEKEYLVELKEYENWNSDWKNKVNNLGYEYNKFMKSASKVTNKIAPEFTMKIYSEIYELFGGDSSKEYEQRFNQKLILYDKINSIKGSGDSKLSYLDECFRGYKRMQLIDSPKLLNYSINVDGNIDEIEKLGVENNLNQTDLSLYKKQNKTLIEAIGVLDALNDIPDVRIYLDNLDTVIQTKKEQKEYQKEVNFLIKGIKDIESRIIHSKQYKQ